MPYVSMARSRAIQVRTSSFYSRDTDRTQDVKKLSNAPRNLNSMHFKLPNILFALTSSASLVAGVLLTYDAVYDNKDNLLSDVACSDGSHGLESRYQTFGSLPNFPYVGAAPTIEGWNSVNCGSCWQLTYVPDNGANQTSINMLAIDAGTKFVTGIKAMDVLTNGHSIQLGRVNVTAQEVSSSKCGI
ncbi:hypothetical protein AX15_004965 [Amanita polypyramis BW_CC]|nr:hypothetical protein AX15_004965 [Amanita polypyramis BW_CC]